NVGEIIDRTNKGNRSDTVLYRVQPLKDLSNVIIPHFDKYTLLKKKKADYILFKEIVGLMNEGKHRTKEGFAEIIAKKGSMNKGLNENLRKEFSDVLLAPRPEVIYDSNLLFIDPQ